MNILIFKENTFICSYRGGIVVTPYVELISIECDKPLVKFRLKHCALSGKCSLSSIDVYLNDFFIRINRQVIVNMQYATSISKRKDGHWLQLEYGLEYKISVRNIKNVYSSFLIYTKS